MKPAPLQPEFEEAAERLALKIFGRSRRDSILNDICVNCGSHVVLFNSTAGVNEYVQSGLCYTCQQKLFKETTHEHITTGTPTEDNEKEGD